MKCGKGHQHASVDEVRACYGVTTVSYTPGEAYVSQHDRRPTQPTAQYAPASPKQVNYIVDLLGSRQIPVERSGDAELLWKQCEAHHIDERTPGDGTPMPYHIARTALDWLTKLPSKIGGPNGLPDVPAGHYAITSLTGNNDLDFFRVDRPTEGDWAGRIFVKRVIGGKPDAPVRGGNETRNILSAIKDAGVEDAARLYGTEIGRCYRCNRHLTDKISRELGIGPECRSK